jgi:MFS family permease
MVNAERRLRRPDTCSHSTSAFCLLISAYDTTRKIGMALTITIAIVVVLFGSIGVARGTRRGIVTLVGTLFGAVLVDLWQDRWAEWLRTERGVEQPAFWAFLITAVVFVLAALVIGYGSSMLLRKDPQAAPITAGDRLLGGLVGALNGALIVSYLLRYAEEAWTNGAATDVIAGSPVAAILAAWLAWFVLALVVTTGIFVLLRVTLTVGKALTARPAPAPAPTPAATAGTASDKAAKAPAKPDANQAKAADQRTLDKINQTLGE